VANETADNTTWSERARAEEREVKRLGNQIRMIKRNVVSAAILVHTLIYIFSSVILYLNTTQRM